MDTGVSIVCFEKKENMDVKSAEHLEKVLLDHVNHLVVIHFWAPWAPQCQQMTDVMVELSKDSQHKEVTFLKAEAESVPEVSQKYEIAAVPTCILIKGGRVVERVNGAKAAELTQKVQQYATPITGPANTEKKTDLNTRLRQLLNSAPVLLFMKGSAEQPKCGFSKQMIQILNDHGVKYSTFDILQDEEVRQGLKKFSNWPTYPQLYAQGELLGGLDIVKELVETGEFQSSLPRQETLEERLPKLIGRENVMLFMKGDRDQPKCGFSKTMIQILNESGVTYGTFDILQDEEVRQGLKKYSDWPTYPQLYVKSDLVGGLDIVKELLETGELQSTLAGS